MMKFDSFVNKDDLGILFISSVRYWGAREFLPDEVEKVLTNEAILVSLKIPCLNQINEELKIIVQKDSYFDDNKADKSFWWQLKRRVEQELWERDNYPRSVGSIDCPPPF